MMKSGKFSKAASLGAVLFAMTTSAVCAASFSDIDANKDNRLQVSEMISVFGTRAQSFIERWDANSDGELTRREIRQSNASTGAERKQNARAVSGGDKRPERINDEVKSETPSKQDAAERPEVQTEAERKAEQKAERKAERQAEKARKAAERKAERQAEKARKAAERKAEREAQKAQRARAAQNLARLEQSVYKKQPKKPNPCELVN